jgi:hypothetical protein
MNKNLISDFEEIKKSDDLALIHKIKHYLDYNKNTVLFAYAELISRGEIMNGRYVNPHLESINKDLNDFITSKHFSPGPDILYKELLISLDGATTPTPPHQSNSSSYLHERKYPALRTISDIYKIFGILVIIITIIIAFFLGNVSFGFTLIALVIGALIVLGVFAVSEAIKVFIDIEENTRLRNKE